MSRRIRSIGVFLVIVFCAGILGGCGGAQKTAPHMSFGQMGVETQITRDDIVVLDPVEGSSTETTVLGVINVIDGNKLQLFGIKFFKDKFTYFKDSGWIRSPQCADRAYYKALEAAPEADAVFAKTMDNEEGGIPLLWTTKAVTFRGKAIKLKCDK